VQNLPVAVRDSVMTGLADSIAYVFVWAAAIVVLVPVLAWFIKEIPLRGAAEEPADRAIAGEDGESPADEAEVALTRTPTAGP
jgi:hypothetical protein